MASVETAEQELALADDAFARFDMDATVVHLSAAIRQFTVDGDNRQAAMVGIRLGDLLAHVMGNLTAGRAWFARARRLVESEPPCVEQGWVAVAAMGCDVDDPDELLAAADVALDRARRFGDLNLETKALADAGLAHVQAGRVTQGMALLDEAMALACGPADDANCAARSACSLFTACYYTADFERAGSWAELLRRRGLIGQAPGPPLFLSSHCDSLQAVVLVELGRWADAERLLERGRAEYQAAMHGPSWHLDIVLGGLRTRQGRFADAEALLLGKDQVAEALLPAARLHLARGDHELARAAATRGLRNVCDDRLRAVELLSVLVDAELARGRTEAAATACADLSARVGQLDIPVLQAHAAATEARVAVAREETEAAIAAFERAIDLLDVGQSPWRRASLGLELARCREAAGDVAGARLDAKVAASILADLDVLPGPADTALLDRLRPSGAPAAATAVLVREAKWWTASCGGTSVRLADTKGLRYLAELVDRPGAERHALDLVDRVEGVGNVDRRAIGDAGSVLDARARAAYRARIEELRMDIDDALAADQLEAAERLQAELDELVAELARAFGLGGRDRRAASAAERARLNVTRALRAALAKLVETLPGPATILAGRIRTGLYCAYEPAGDDSVRWIVQS